MSGTVLGIYTNLEDAEKTLAALKKKGFSDKNSGILARGLEDTQMQIPAGNDTTQLGLAGGAYPDFGSAEADVFTDIQSTLSSGSMTSPEHAQTSYVEQGVNSHEEESTDDNTTSYPVAGYFSAVTNRADSFHPTYRGYTGANARAGVTGDYDDGKAWSSYSGKMNQPAERYSTTVRHNNETMPAFGHTSGKFTGQFDDGKAWNQAGRLPTRGKNTADDEYVVAVRVDKSKDITGVIKTMGQYGAIDTETFENEN